MSSPFAPPDTQAKTIGGDEPHPRLPSEEGQNVRNGRTTARHRDNNDRPKTNKTRGLGATTAPTTRGVETIRWLSYVDVGGSKGWDLFERKSTHTHI